MFPVSDLLIRWTYKDLGKPVTCFQHLLIKSKLLQCINDLILGPPLGPHSLNLHELAAAIAVLQAVLRTCEYFQGIFGLRVALVV